MRKFNHGVYKIKVEAVPDWEDATSIKAEVKMLASFSFLVIYLSPVWESLDGSLPESGRIAFFFFLVFHIISLAIA